MRHPRKCVNHATLCQNCVILRDPNRAIFALFFDGKEIKN